MRNEWLRALRMAFCQWHPFARLGMNFVVVGALFLILAWMDSTTIATCPGWSQPIPDWRWLRASEKPLELDLQRTWAQVHARITANVVCGRWPFGHEYLSDLEESICPGELSETVDQCLQEKNGRGG